MWNKSDWYSKITEYDAAWKHEHIHVALPNTYALVFTTIVGWDF